MMISSDISSDINSPLSLPSLGEDADQYFRSLFGFQHDQAQLFEKSKYFVPLPWILQCKSDYTLAENWTEVLGSITTSLNTAAAAAAAAAVAGNKSAAVFTPNDTYSDLLQKLLSFTVTETVSDSGEVSTFSRKMVTLHDIKSTDVKLYQSHFKYLEETALTPELIVSIYGEPKSFTFDSTYLGATTTFDLVPNGKKIFLCEENKLIYLNLLADFLARKSILSQLQAILQTMERFIKFDVIKSTGISLAEFETLLIGSNNFNVDDWKANCRYASCGENDLVIKLFWKYISELSQEMRQKLFQFATGQRRLPYGGFSALSEKFQIEVSRGMAVDSLPSVRTCFHTLILPMYTSYSVLEQKINFAINNCMSLEFV